MSETQTTVLTKKDYVSDQAVRWCPGCGDYAILSQTQKTVPTFGRGLIHRTCICETLNPSS